MLGVASVVCLLLAPVFGWDVEIPNHSPLIHYEPYSDGTTDGGWALWSSDVGFYPTKAGEKTVGGQTASGTTAHISSATGASFTFSFKGTAITLYGTANVAYTVTFDNAVHNSLQLHLPQGVLFQQDNLEPVDHYLNLTLATVHGNQQMSFEKAVITSASTEKLKQNTFDSNNSNVMFTGSWESTGIKETPLYRQTSHYDDSVEMTFTNARAVAANANINWGHWDYVVEFDNEQTTLNASTWWLVGDTFLFFKDGLDPAREYTVKLKNGGQTFSFTSFSTWEPQLESAAGADGAKTDGSETQQETEDPRATNGGKAGQNNTGNPKVDSPSLSRGTVAGIVVAAVTVAALCIGLLVFVLVRRRRRQQDSAHRIFPLVDEKVVGSARSSAHGAPRTSPLMLEEVHTTPYPAPIATEYPRRPPGLGSDQLSVPPSVSTEGGIGPAGARRSNRDKKRQLQNQPPARDVNASPTQSTLSGPPRSEGSASRDRETVERVLAMLVERIDTRPVHDNGAPPSYMSDTGPRPI
ncbi:hypothetical protein AURDEDRAFT_185799 [Auricularia subglabra TFB-10046 SS5]|nr:hypothetical protein AURDEDRAFT_185799 [Auricularia subglabra TFB-10046 SS5]